MVDFNFIIIMKRGINMKRLKLLAVAMCVITTISMVGCGSSGDTTKAQSNSTSKFSGQKLVVGVWGGTWKDAFEEACVKPFEEETGVTIEMEEMGDNIVAQTKAQVQQNIPGIDLVAGVGNADFAMYLGKEGAIKELDYNKIPNSKYVDDAAKTKYGIGQYICAINFTYDKDKFSEIPKGAAGFWDTKTYPGDRAMIGFSAAGVLEQALLADGVTYKDLYPLDIDRAFKKLDELKPSITKFWNSGSEIVQTINDKEAVAGDYWYAHANRAKNAGSNIAVNMQDGPKFADSFGIVSNTKSEDLSYAFIDYCLGTKAQAAFSQKVGYAPINKEAVSLLPEEMQKTIAPLYESYENGGTFWVDQNYWVDNFEELTKRYMEWVAK